MCNYDVILHPTDFSENSDQVFQLACNMARDQFSSLVVVHVLPPRSGPINQTELDDEDCPALEECRRHFRRMKSWAPDIPLTFRVVHGSTVNAILNVAHEAKAELIVIASHPHTHFYLQLHGSTTEALLRLSHCPVLVLRQPTNLDGRQIGAGFSNQSSSAEAK